MDDHTPLRALTNRRAMLARREQYGCNAAGNAQRLARLLKSRGPDAGMVYARHLVARLPSIVRVEAAEARAAAVDMELSTKNGEKAYTALMLKAQTLTEWACQCAYESTQDDALLCLERLMREAVPS